MSEIAHNDAAHHIVVKAHPIRLYLVVWAWLFVLSAFSYLVALRRYRAQAGEWCRCEKR